MKVIHVDEDVMPASDARKYEERVSELLGRKTMEGETLKEAPDVARAKADLAVTIARAG